jgi:DNA-binding transcriptional MocR family regulator
MVAYDCTVCDTPLLPYGCPHPYGCRVPNTTVRTPDTGPARPSRGRGSSKYPEVHAKLRSQIMSGKRGQPGDWMSKKQLSADFSVNDATMTKVIALLVADGLVENLGRSRPAEYSLRIRSLTPIPSTDERIAALEAQIRELVHTRRPADVTSQLVKLREEIGKLRDLAEGLEARVDAIEADREEAPAEQEERSTQA